MGNFKTWLENVSEAKSCKVNTILLDDLMPQTYATILPIQSLDTSHTYSSLVENHIPLRMN
jgi:hypothetical protein